MSMQIFSDLHDADLSLSQLRSLETRVENPELEVGCLLEGIELITHGGTSVGTRNLSHVRFFFTLNDNIHCCTFS
jgi:hypothetical protein